MLCIDSLVATFTKYTGFLWIVIKSTIFLCLSVSKKKYEFISKWIVEETLSVSVFFLIFFSISWSIRNKILQTILTVSSIAKWQADKKIIGKIKRMTNAIDNVAHCNSKKHSTSNHSTVKSADFFFYFFICQLNITLMSRIKVYIRHNDMWRTTKNTTHSYNTHVIRKYQT